MPYASTCPCDVLNNLGCYKCVNCELGYSFTLLSIYQLSTSLFTMFTNFSQLPYAWTCPCNVLYNLRCNNAHPPPPPPTPLPPPPKKNPQENNMTS